MSLQAYIHTYIQAITELTVMTVKTLIQFKLNKVK